MKKDLATFQDFVPEDDSTLTMVKSQLEYTKDVICTAATTKLEYKTICAMTTEDDCKHARELIVAAENKYNRYRLFVRQKCCHPAVLRMRDVFMAKNEKPSK